MPDATIDMSELVALAAGLRRTPGIIRTSVTKSLTKWGATGETLAKQNVSGKILKRRSGDLAQRISFRVTAEGANKVLRIGVLGGADKVLRYAAVHDPPDDRTETTIVPKPPGKVLTIPLKAAKTPTGRPRFTATEAKGFFEDTFWENFKGGSDNPVLYGVRISRKGAKLVPLFVGVPRVTIPARRPIGKAGDEVFPQLRAELETRVTGIVRRAAERRA